jgi:integrase
MPRRKAPPRLYLIPKEKQWVIRDGARFIRTGCGERGRAEAEKQLAQYIGRKHKPEPSGSPMIADVLALYGDEVAPTRKTARNISYNITNLVKWWGDKTAAQVNKKACQAYAATKAEQGAAADLKVLKAALTHWHESDNGPLNTIPIVWRPDPNPPRDRWLDREEAARLVKASKPFQHLRRMVLLGLYTGSRPGVILALRWDQIDFRSGVMHRKPKDARQSKQKPAPAVRLGRRILGHLRRWKKIDGDARYVCQFMGMNQVTGRPVEDPHAAWARIVKAAKLKDVTRHTLRHTRATWMARAGVPMWEAAGFLGMTLKTLERVYAHHDPSHQETAANI